MLDKRSTQILAIVESADRDQNVIFEILSIKDVSAEKLLYRNNRKIKAEARLPLVFWNKCVESMTKNGEDAKLLLEGDIQKLDDEGMAKVWITNIK